MNKLKNFPYEKALVLGLAKSGTVTAQVLLENGIDVVVNDLNTEKEAPAVQQLMQQGAEVVVGSHPLSVLHDVDLIIKNPGIPYENIIIKQAMKYTIPIVTEIELASLLISNEQLIGITGTNGKTTTTTLVGDMLIQSDKKVKVAGNIGVVATEQAQTLDDNETLLLELSSFQLMGIETFHPHIAALLNLYEAHLDYHGSFENYIKAKANIINNQTSEDYLIYNADDVLVTEVVKQSQAQLIPFSTKKRHLNGAWADDENIYYDSEKIITRQNIALVGEHNLANILAAINISMLKGATKEGIAKVLTHFTGVKHRLQHVQTVNGRRFYNDSKATNLLASEIALQSFTAPLIWLAGGLDRGNDFDSLLPYVNHVKAMVVFGQTAEKLSEFAKKADIDTVITVADVEEAVQEAYKLSNLNDVILLSPACASWDQYKTFEERGDMFINAVHILAKGE